MDARQLYFGLRKKAEGAGPQRAWPEPRDLLTRQEKSAFRVLVFRLSFCALVTLMLFMTDLSRCHAAGLETEPFHVGFSSSTFGEVNENDATAAVKIWSKSLAENTGLPLDPQPFVFSRRTDIVAALRARTLDAINLTTDEYWRLREYLASDHCILGVQNDRTTVDFLILVRQDGGITGMGDLHGRSIVFLESPGTRLAAVWLETLLLQSKRGRTAEFFGRVLGVNKLTRAVLPVFFKQTDACVVTRRGFDTMVELNPQVGRELKVLVASPALVPFLFAFRADYTSPVRDQVLAQLKTWHTTAAGQQILTLFQCDRVEDHPVSVLATSLELLDDHARLLGGGQRSPAD